jgi:hypothetical protein
MKSIQDVFKLKEEHPLNPVLPGLQILVKGIYRQKHEISKE